MCGFLSYINKNFSNEKFLEKKFNYFHKTLNHRGPDYQTSLKLNYNNSSINLGFSRLAIQDLSIEANKIFKDDKCALLFNGEIYNCNYLKNKYLTNTEFATKTDTEILFQLLKKFNIDIIRQIEGIFSIAFFDFKENKLFLARDPTGTKPLYFSKNQNHFCFSSEAWFLYSLSNKELDYQALNYYFKHGFSPTNKTLITGVKKIRPGHYLIVDLDDFSTKEKKYFEFDYFNTNNQGFDELETDIENTIEKNLISDSKVGIFLSGGLDSSIISILSKKKDSQIQAFTSCFLPNDQYKKFNEDLHYAEKLSKLYDIKLNKVYLDTNNKLQKEDLINAYSKLDEPLPNLNFFNSYLQAKSAKDSGCKVILTGDGSDEIFGGYDRYKKLYIAERFFFLSKFNKKINAYNQLKKKELVNFFYNKFLDSSYFEYNFYQMKKNYNFDYSLPYEKEKIEIINFFDLFHWLPEESNMKLDRSTMLNSIEGRVPFQDITLIKKYFNISFSKKINLFNEKIPLKKKLNFLPSFVKNRKKIGWISPESFFIRSYLKDEIFETLNQDKLKNQKIFNSFKIKDLLNFHIEGKYYKNQITTIFAFQNWYDQILKIH
jgi:asparagine synthase (glutamine-hydrolysing)